MALLKNIVFKGITVNAYCRIGVINLSKTSIEINIDFKASATDIGFDTFSATTTYDITGENPIRQGYLYLKTLPEFADAVDC